MNRGGFLKIMLILLVLVFAVGLYRGWFELSSDRREETRKVDLRLTVDPGKLKEDAHAVKEKTESITGLDESRQDEPTKQPIQGGQVIER